MYLNRTVQNHILQLLQQHGFIVEESGAELVCLQSWSFTYREHWCIIKRKIRQRIPWTLQQLETYIRQEWDQSPTSKLITLMPRYLQNVLKRSNWLHHGKHAPVPTILRPAAGITFEELILWIKFEKFLSLNICYVIYVVLWIKYWLMWFEILLVFILFKLKKHPNISRIRVV